MDETYQEKVLLAFIQRFASVLRRDIPYPYPLTATITPRSAPVASPFRPFEFSQLRPIFID